MALVGLLSAVELRAEEGDFAKFAREMTRQDVILVRTQSPDNRLPPPQLRVAQSMAVVADPCAPIEPCPPTTIMAQPAFDPYLACPPPAQSPWKTCQIGIFGEFLYLTARNNDVPFAVPQNGLLTPGAAPTGAVGVADLGFEFGFKVGGFFGLGPDSRLAAAYTWYSASTTSSVTASGADVINPLVMFPGTFNAGFTAQEATADYSVEFQFIDIEYQVMGECCESYWFGYLLGARYGRLTQSFSAEFPFAPPDGTTNVNTDIDFDGIGPRAGLQGERCIFPRTGFRAYGKSSAGLLVGRFRNTYLQTNQFNGTEVNTSLNEDRIVPVVDLELGLAWLSPGQHIRISGGYLVTAWFNSVTTTGWIQSVQNTSFNPPSDTITFDGLTARAELRF